MQTKAKYTRGDANSASSPTIKFSDIAGMNQAKTEVKEYVEYLKNPTRFQVRKYVTELHLFIMTILYDDFIFGGVLCE